jgi:hypothetical protein
LEYRPKNPPSHQMLSCAWLRLSGIPFRTRRYRR